MQNFPFRKISLFIPNLDGGGAERVFINLARIFKNNGFEVNLVVGIQKGSLTGCVDDIDIIDLQSESVSKALFPLVRYLSKNKPDIIMSAMPHANLATIIAVTMSSAKSRIICTVHEDAFSVLQYLSGYDKFILKVMKYMYRFSHGIVTVSNGLLQSQRKFYGNSLPNKQTAIYNPIITDQSAITQLRIPENKGTSEKPFNIITAGRLRFEKDFSTLIKAFSLLPDKENVRLTIYGEGPEREKLNRLIKDLSLEEHVSMPGFSNDINTCFRASDLFILSSIWEGFGNVIVEAMAAGCPVIATDCRSGPREILEDGKYGYLTCVGDYTEIAGYIELVRAGEIEKFNTKKAVERFMFTNIGLQYLNFFKECYS